MEAVGRVCHICLLSRCLGLWAVTSATQVTPWSHSSSGSISHVAHPTKSQSLVPYRNHITHPNADTSLKIRSIMKAEQKTVERRPFLQIPPSKASTVSPKDSGWVERLAYCFSDLIYCISLLFQSQHNISLHWKVRVKTVPWSQAGLHTGTDHHLAGGELPWTAQKDDGRWYGDTMNTLQCTLLNPSMLWPLTCSL